MRLFQRIILVLFWLTSVPAGATESYEPATTVGAPAGRVGPGTRGGNWQIYVNVLAPARQGMVTQAQPTLYWFSSHAIKNVDFCLNKRGTARIGEVEELLKATLEAPQAGIQAIKLADYGVKLESGALYEWNISLPQMPDHTVKQVSSATLQLAPLAGPAQNSLHQTAPWNQVRVYERNGYWYDAFDTLYGLLASYPADSQLQRQRAELLEAAGLLEVADFTLAEAR